MKVFVHDESAFSLIELMIAMAIAGVVAAAMYAFQQGQIQTHVTQETVVNMHQNARAAMHFLTSEIRMAGCDPMGIAGAGITSATDNAISFTMDFTGGENDGTDNNGNGETDEGLESYDGSIDDPGESVTYQLTGGDIIRTALSRVLNTEGNLVVEVREEVLAQNFEALEFEYFAAPDPDGTSNQITTPADGSSLPPSDRARIHAIQITVLARSSKEVPGFMRSGSFRRITLTSEVRLRNAGLI